MLKKITITLDPDLARWVQRRAADADTSVSKFIARLLEREMRAADSYWRAFEEWKNRDRDVGVPIDASKRFSRPDAHERKIP